MKFGSLAIAAAVSVLFGGLALGAPKKYKVIKVKDGSTIEGRVVFSGKPTPQVLAVTKDPSVCCPKGGASKPSPRLVVGEDSGVQDTVVFLVDVASGKDFPKAEAILDQKECSFQPHITLVKERGELKVRNSDPVLHNVHGFLGGMDAFNLAMPTKDQVVKKRLRRPGIISLKCDAGHTWMSGYVFVIKHPYYAVTEEDGSFSLENIPAGKYALRVWHEGWKAVEGRYKETTLDVPVELAEKAKVEINFELKPDGSLTQSSKKVASK